MKNQQVNPQIAVIGMAARFPDAPTVKAFWHNIQQGKCSVRSFSPDNLKVAGVPEAYLDSGEYQGVTAPLAGVENFDADFFDFNQRDAEIMDPQFRQFFEVAWLALEDAGMARAHKRQNIGVFSSSGMSLYSDKHMNNYFKINVQSHHKLMETLDPIQAKVLTEREYLPTQLSYKLNLKGPSIPVNTACSSSLVAIHLALQSLLNGECDAALAGAAAIHAPHIAGYLYNQGSIFSADGVCRPFDAKANGIVGGNGVGIVVLKTLEKAVADNDRIYAVIKGSAINNDGSMKVSYTAPSVEGQKNNIVNAIEKSGIDINSIGLIEAHGTGTALGDPVEIGALNQAFKQLSYQLSEQHNKVTVGSVKSNIGHLDTAAGIASFIKTVCAVYYGVLPGTANFVNPNPSMRLQKTPFSVSATSADWHDNTAQRHALVGALGAGGTNAHLVIGGYQHRVKPAPKSSCNSENSTVLFVSGKTEAAMLANLAAIGNYIRATDVPLTDICYSAATGNAFFEYRCIVVGQTRKQMLDAIDNRGGKLFFSGQLIKSKTSVKSPLVLQTDSLARLTSLEQVNLLSEIFCTAGFDPASLYLYKTYVSQPFNRVSLPGYCFEKRRCWLDFNLPLMPNHIPPPSITYTRKRHKVAELCTTTTPYLLLQDIQKDQQPLTALLPELVYRIEQKGIETIVMGTQHFCYDGDSLVFSRQLCQLGAFVCGLDEQLSKIVKLVLVVCQSEQINDAPDHSMAACLWSGLKAAGHELIHIEPTFIETDTNGSMLNTLLKSKTLTLYGKGAEFAITDGVVYHHSLVPLPTSNSTDVLVSHSQGIDIIIGGNGGIGKLLCKHLVERGCQNILVVSRRPADENSQQHIKRLAEQSISFCYIVGDSGDAATWQMVADKVDELGLEVNHIYHLAGVLEDALLANLQESAMARVLSAKLDTCQQLTSWLDRLKPKHLILFSSLSAAIGAPGQFSYAVANGYLDGWAKTLKAKGVNATSIQWGPWANSGMVQDTQEKEASNNVERIELLESSVALAAMERCIDASEVGFTIANLSAQLAKPEQRQLSPFEMGLSLFSSHIQRACTDKAEQSIDSDNVDPDKIVSLVHGVITTLAGVSEGDKAYADKTFSQLSIDSLGITHLRMLISNEIGLNLSISELYSYPTANSLSQYLKDKCQLQQTPCDVHTERGQNQRDPERDALIAEICQLLE